MTDTAAAGPRKQGVVLGPLILVAAVANLNLAVANGSWRADSGRTGVSAETKSMGTVHLVPGGA